MKRNSERVYWMTNKDWYTVNRVKDCFELTDAAPPRARRSFAMWSRPKKMTFRRLLRICKTYIKFR